MFFSVYFLLTTSHYDMFFVFLSAGEWLVELPLSENGYIDDEYTEFWSEEVE